MKALQNLMYSLRAGYPYFYIQTMEMTKTVNDINLAIVAEDIGWTTVIWDFEKIADPKGVIDLLINSNPKTLVIAKNWNWFLNTEYEGIDKEAVTILQNKIDLFASSSDRKALIVLSNTGIEMAIPSELVNDFLQIKFDRPDAIEIRKNLDYIIESVKTNPSFVLPDASEKEALVDAGKGMTTRELNAAYSYSLVQTGGTLDPKIVARQRAKEVEKTAGLTIGDYPESLEDTIGYDVAKKFAAMNVKSPLSKGMLLVGPPGTGKTTFARGLANTFGMVCIEMEMAQLFGGIVGETEEKVRLALDIIRANAPCIWFIDEIEKGLAGVGGGGANTSNSGSEITQRAMAQVLKFMSHDRPPGVYCIATSNDAKSLPPEWVRPGRWDSAPWYVGLPNAETKASIFDHYIEAGFQVEGMDEPLFTTGDALSDKDTEKWTGAEIETVCRLSAQMGMKIEECKQFIRPVAVTMAEQIKALEDWAIKEGRTIPAESTAKNALTINREVDF
jgi:hypothetical protein